MRRRLRPFVSLVLAFTLWWVMLWWWPQEPIGWFLLYGVAVCFWFADLMYYELREVTRHMTEVSQFQEQPEMGEKP